MHQNCSCSFPLMLFARDTRFAFTNEGFFAADIADAKLYANHRIVSPVHDVIDTGGMILRHGTHIGLPSSEFLRRPF